MSTLTESRYEVWITVLAKTVEHKIVTELTNSHFSVGALSSRGR